MNLHRILASIVTFLMTLVTGSTVHADERSFARPEYPTSIWYSSGDALFEYHWMPMASEATVNAAYDIIHKRYNVDRMLWRDANVQWMLTWDKTWEFGYLGDSLHDWLYFANDLKVAEYARKAAHERDMQFWGIWSLYDYGGKASTRAGEGQGPWEGYDPWLAANPQYLVYDRAGITYNTSVIEYGYPEVRAEYARRLEEMFAGQWKIYDGIFMYTYIEHASVRYSEEYIYTDIACEEYKQKYGVDPRTDPFDLDNYLAIRGDYITQYLRDIRPIFKKHNKQLAIALNAKNMELPQEWLNGRSSVLQQGPLRMDWRTWIEEGLVDELHVFSGADEETTLRNAEKLIEATQGTGIRVTVASNREFPESMQHLYEKNVRRMIYADDRSEDGYQEDVSIAELESDDPLALLSILRQARNGSLKLSDEQLITLLHNENPMVRRQAAQAIGIHRRHNLLAELETVARQDPEAMVVAMAIDAFGEINGPDTMSAIEAAFERHPLWPVRRATIIAINRMGKARRGDIRKAFESDNAYFREILLESVYDTEQPDKEAFYQTVPEFLDMLTEGAKDPNAKVRWRAARSLAAYPNTSTAGLLLTLLDDEEHGVQSSAARALKVVLQNAIFVAPELRQEIFDKLLARYHEFGDNSTREDAEWGFRTFGEALKEGFGIKGKNALIDILNGENKPLARITWQVLFLNEDYRWVDTTRKQMEEFYTYYPDHPQRKECPHTVVD